MSEPLNMKCVTNSDADKTYYESLRTHKAGKDLVEYTYTTYTT